MLACLAAAAVFAALPGDARAAKPSEFFGVVPFGYPTSAELARIHRGGARSIRIGVSWPTIEPSQGVRNWEQLDAFIADASRNGIAVLPSFYGTPAWLSANSARPPIYSPAQRAAWTAFVRDAAARYGGLGTFWTARPDLPRRPLVIWQVWNEVNLGYYWGGPPNARAYLDLVGLTREALRAGDPSAKVLSAGLIPFKSAAAQTVAGDRFLSRLYKMPAARKLIDAVDIHPYGSTPPIVLKSLHEMRTVLNRVGARRTPLWVTEFGWTTGGPGWESSPLRATLTQQAKRVSSTYRSLLKSRRRLRLKRAFYLSLADVPAPGSGTWIDHMGLFDASGQPKPAWFAFVRRAGGQP